jgi:hypothetical protein
MTRREEKLYKIVMDIYREMYKNAEPSADIDELIKTGEGREEFFFNKYYLSADDQERITVTELLKHKLRGYDKKRIMATLMWGASPCTNKETVNSYRKELGLDII